MNLPDPRIRELLKQREQALRYLGVLIERAGGEVLILPAELAEDRTVGREDGVHGTVKLTVGK